MNFYSEICLHGTRCAPASTFLRRKILAREIEADMASKDFGEAPANAPLFLNGMTRRMEYSWRTIGIDVTIFRI